jgi:probable phosphoglycerate mutase
MTTFHLVRHAAHDLLGHVLAGRKIDVPLNATGRRQAQALALQLRTQPINYVFSSPRKRARQTAEPIAATLGVAVAIAPQIDEHDAGIWSGLSFAELARDPRWRLWNERRDIARPPAGESMAELQKRVVRYLDLLTEQHPDDTIVVVSHAEPLRAVLLHERGISLRDFLQIDPPVASVTTLTRAPAMKPVPA